MLKRYVIMVLVTLGLLGGSLAVSMSPAEAQGRGGCHQVWRHGHWVTRCQRGWGESRAYSRGYYRSHPRAYSRRYYQSYPRAYSRGYTRPYGRSYSGPYSGDYSRRYR